MPPAVSEIVTPRLKLLPMTLRAVLAAQQNEAALATCLQKRCVEGCLDPSFTRVLTDLAACLAADPSLAAWNRWVVKLAADPAEEAVIGTIGFLTRPDDLGVVELGYSIAPPEQNLGYATEAARGLIGFAFSQRSVRTVAAMCREDNPASMKVLEKTGFVRVEELGPMWAWELNRATYEAQQRDKK
ncbi:MAG TPA: GNAT family N-acetyltransferase [Pirellulales bacterium]